MGFESLIKEMTQFIVQGDGEGAASCFAKDGYYDDVFYGLFNQPNIPDLIENYFHRDAENFVWEIVDSVSSKDIGYARYVFSYDSKLEVCVGKRAIFEGVSICHLKQGKILSYHEIANVHTGLAMMGFAPSRLSKIAIAQADKLTARVSAEHRRSVRV